MRRIKTDTIHDNRSCQQTAGASKGERGTSSKSSPWDREAGASPRNRLTSLFAAFVVIWSSSAMAQYGPFPTVETKDLNGRELTLPQDLPGTPTLVLIAFTQGQQSGVNRWIDAMQLESREDIQWIEMPVVASGTRVIGPMLDGWMRQGIQDLEMRARTITVYGRRKYLRAFGLDTFREVAVVVAFPDGRVQQVVQGEPTEDRLAAIERALKVAQ